MNSTGYILLFITLFLSSYSYANDDQEQPPLKVKTEQRIVISQPDLEYSLLEVISKRVLKEAYSRIGEEVQFELFPIERSVVVANDGITDGELARMAGIQKKYPNLIQVSVPVSSFDIFVYSRFQIFTVKGWQSLKPYKFDFIYGFKYAEKMSKGMNTSRIKSRFQALSKLNEGRSHLFVGVLSTECAIKRFKFTHIKRLTPPLDKVVMYHYLHKKNKNIVKKLETVLSNMQKNGEIHDIEKQEKKKLLSQCSFK